MLKGKPLSIQIWLWFIVGIGLCGILTASIIYYTLESNLEDQLFQDIEAKQQNNMASSISVEAREAFDSIKVIPSAEVKHFQVSTPANLIVEPQFVTISPNQLTLSATGRFQEDNLYYVVSEQTIGNKSVYLYSLKSQNMAKEVISKFWYVFIGIIIIMMLMLLPAHIIARRLTSPLLVLQGDMQRIAKRKWNEPILVTGSAEFTDLAKSCESMRQQLIQYDSKQQNMLQSISHELKTPLMVIRSYIQAIKDGFYPQGSLVTSLETIDKETDRLQNKVLDLIYITNLEYLAANNQRLYQDINLGDIIKEVYERMQYSRSDVQWEFDLKHTVIKGDQQQWKVVFENILQNALRYAKNLIQVSLHQQNGQTICRIYNDGQPIADQSDSLFKVYQKGINGESGLGLNIVKRIIDLYDGEVRFENEDNGVAFYISVS